MSILKFTPVLLFLFVIQLNAQTPPPNGPVRQIEITGQGEMKVAPDEGVLLLNIQALEQEFGQSISELSNKEKAIVKKLTSLGYKKEDIRTSNFSVREHYDWKDGKRINKGYMASQSMSIKFPNEKERIGKILDAFSKSETDAQFSFQFKLSDELEKKSKELVLEKAVADARRNADLLAGFSGVKIKSVLRINYSPNGPQPMYRMAANYANMAADGMESSRNDGFQAQDITLTDNVLIIYELE